MLDLIYFQNTKHPGTKENHEATSIHEKPSQASYEIQSSSHFATKPGGGGRGWETSRCSHLSGRNHFNTVALITNETGATRKTSSQTRRRKKDEEEARRGGWWPGLIKRLRHYALSAVTSPKSVGAISNSRDTTNKGNARHRGGRRGKLDWDNRGSEHARVDRGRGRIGEVEVNLRI